MNWDAVVPAGGIGAIFGASVGLVPLILGYRRQRKGAGIVSFLACIINGFLFYIATGAVGSIIASVIVMLVTTVDILKVRHQVQKQSFATGRDKLWFLVGFLWWWGICMEGTLWISTKYLTPLVLGISHSTPKDATGRALETAMIYGSMGVGTILGLVGISFISRRIISAETHANWDKEYKMHMENGWPILRKFRRMYFQFLLPRDWPSMKK